MSVKISNLRTKDNGGDGLRIEGDVEVDVKGVQADGNKGYGVNIIPGEKSSIAVDDIDTTNNQLGGLVTKYYDKNIETIAQYAYSNIKKIDKEDYGKLVNLLEKARKEEKLEHQRPYLREVYDIFKKGLLMPTMSASVKAAFKAFLDI